MVEHISADTWCFMHLQPIEPSFLKALYGTERLMEIEREISALECMMVERIEFSLNPGERMNRQKANDVACRVIAKGRPAVEAIIENPDLLVKAYRGPQKPVANWQSVFANLY
jgi:hypothetical protein